MNLTKKSQLTSFLFTLLLGPLGLFYSSMTGGIILCVLAIISAPTIAGPILCWPIAIIAGIGSVSSHNKNVDATILLLGRGR